MPLYIKLAEKKVENRLVERFAAALFILNELFSFLDKSDKKFLLFEDFPFASISDKLKTFDLEIGMLNKIKEEINESTGFELTFSSKIGNKSIPFVFTLLPSKYSTHSDILLEIIPNGFINRFIEVEKYVPNFRSNITGRIKKYNSSKDKKRLYVDRAIISIEGKEIHSFDEYKFFYARKPEHLIIELVSISKKLKNNLLFADKNRFAKEIVNYDKFLLLMDSVANKNAIDISGGSITVVPKGENNMAEFSSELTEKLEQFVEAVYPTKDEINENLNKIFTDV